MITETFYFYSANSSACIIHLHSAFYLYFPPKDIFQHSHTYSCNNYLGLKERSPTNLEFHHIPVFQEDNCFFIK